MIYTSGRKNWPGGAEGTPRGDAVFGLFFRPDEPAVDANGWPARLLLISRHKAFISIYKA